MLLKLQLFDNSRKVGIAFPAIDTKDEFVFWRSWIATLFKGRFAILSDISRAIVACCLRTITKQLLVAVLVLQTGNAFTAMVTSVSRLIVARVKAMVAEETGPSYCCCCCMIEKTKS